MTRPDHERRVRDLLGRLNAWLAIRKQATERVAELVDAIRAAEGRQ